MLTFLADTLSLCLSAWLAYAIRTSETLFTVEPYLRNPAQYGFLVITAVIIWHILLFWMGGYEHKLLLFRLDELLLQFRTSMLLFLFLMAITFLYHSYDYSRLIILLWWLFFVVLGGIGRQIAYKLRERLHARGWGRRRVILSGASPRRELVEKRLGENAGLGADVVAYEADIPLTDVLASQWIDEIFLFDDKTSYEILWELREKSLNSDILIHLVPSFGALYLRQFTAGFFDGVVMMTISSPLARRITLACKRAFDILVSAFFLLLLVPFVLVIALLVKIDSSGPVFFRQKRIGRNGVEFTIYKFRTMFENAQPYALTPTDRSDPRITRVGSFLRSTGLDELPQLWNVLIGDMSLVGPRPEMPFIVQNYTRLEAKRLKVRPGITGLWQVYARTENLPIHFHIEYDLFYIENLSISLDLMILLDTVPTLIFRTGI